MNVIRRQDTERRVAPIDSTQRPRVRPGGRRELPEDQDHPVEEWAEGDFAGELARRQAEGEGGPRRERREEEAPAPAAPEDRVEIHGREVPPGEAAQEGESVPPSAEEKRRHLDIRV
jgi:hypothetical protein